MPKNQNPIDLADDILIIDDEMPNLKLLSEMLGREGYQVRPANDPQMAIDSALAQPPKLILLDVRMPQMDGFEVCERLKQDERTRDIPIIFISALQDVQDKVRGFEVGGVDFISKPFQDSEILARLRTHLNLRKLQLNLEELVEARTVEVVESKGALEEAQKLARIGSWSWIVETDTVTWTKTLYEITGLDPKEPPPSYEEHPALYTAESWEKLSQAVARALNDGKPYDLDLDMVRPDGQACHTSTRGMAVKSDDGRVVNLFGTVQDITERKRANEKLAISEAKYRSLVDTSLVGVFQSRIDGGFIFVNDALVKMFDFESPEQMLIEGAVSRWKNPDKREQFLTELQEQGYVTNFESESTTHAGRPIHLLFSATLLGDDITGMVMDITDRKQTEQKIIEYQQSLKALASQLTIAEEKARRAFAAHLHDHVVQSLALARMQIASVRKSTAEADLADKFDELSDTLFKAHEDTQTLMLELSSHSLHDTGLSSAISDWLEGKIRKRHRIETEVIDNVPESRRKTLAPDLRAILFRNVRELVVNDIKHARANKVSVRLEDRNTSIRIIVEDDGIGFDPHGEIQAERKFGGFGLFSIEQLMADLGGSLGVISEPGKGCTAILSAPISVDDNQKRR